MLPADPVLPDQISATGTPASPSFRIATICDSVNRDFRIDPPVVPRESLASTVYRDGEAYVLKRTPCCDSASSTAVVAFSICALVTDFAHSAVRHGLRNAARRQSAQALDHAASAGVGAPAADGSPMRGH